MALIASAAKGVFDVNYTNADIIFLFSFIALVVIGFFLMFGPPARNVGMALFAWAMALIPLGLMFITP